MSALPRLPELLPAENAEALARAVAGLEAPSLWWLSGYAAGLAHARSPAPLIAATALQPAVASPAVADSPVSVAELQAQPRLTVLYGSQTGNARRVAEALVSEAEAAGHAVRLLRADAYPLRELKDERLLSIVISTQGEGEPPEDSLALVEFLASRRAPELKQLRYAVFGLGDSSYAKFCAVGKQLDARLAELGASRISERADADVDIDALAPAWRAGLLQRLREQAAPSSAPSATITPLRRNTAPVAGRDAPYAAELLLQQRISGRGSDKDVRHIELDLANSGLHYEPGDALGVCADNPPALVDAVLQASGLDATATVTLREQTRPLAEWLGSGREITRAPRSLLVELASRHRDAALQQALQSPEQTAAWLAQMPLLDALQRWPLEWSAESLVGTLRPLAPRLYSIASSRAEVGDEAHLTVDVVRYAVDGRIHVGAASSHLARKLAGERVRVFVERNERFRLPADGERDLIMIGAGTGVAPYRGFLQQRAAAGARGRHWLVFGAQRFASDFLYQAEWLQARRQGRLSRIDLAFSRDQADRIYVQQRLREQGAELYRWLADGAHVYVCGALAMGRDVHAALRDIVRQHGGLADDAAEAFLRSLQQAGRYSKDVY